MIYIEYGKVYVKIKEKDFKYSEKKFKKNLNFTLTFFDFSAII